MKKNAENLGYLLLECCHFLVLEMEVELRRFADWENTLAADMIVHQQIMTVYYGTLITN
jgi:hypothetical protein